MAFGSQLGQAVLVVALAAGLAFNACAAGESDQKAAIGEGKNANGAASSEAPLVISKTNSPAAAMRVSKNPAINGGINGMSTLDDKHALVIGDRLSFRIVEDDEDPKPLTVTDSGDLEVPYIGRFSAEGRTCKQLALALKAELEKEYYYQATVIVAVDSMAKSRGKIYLTGPVRQPGPQEVPSDEILTLSKAILRAGGFADFADKKDVKVTRKAAGIDQVFHVDVAAILEKGKSEKDLPLQAGDFIHVAEKAIRF